MLAIKLSLIGWNQAEYTDGIIQLNLWQSQVVFFPPGYSALVWLVERVFDDALMAGRLVSILASVLAIPLLYRLALSVTQNVPAALWAAGFFALSPIYSRWSLRVMTDSLFCTLFIAAAWLFWRAWRDPQKSIWPIVLMAGLASLVRYQGFYFAALSIWLLWLRRSGGLSFSIRSISGWLLASLPWLTLAGWVAMRGFGHHEQFMERGSYGFWTTLLLYYNMFETYLLYWPWAITHGLFAVGCLGLYWMSQREGLRAFVIFLAVTSVVFLTVQSAFLSFQYRYLLPLVPLWCVAAGYGWTVWQEHLSSTWRPVLGGLLLANLIIMSSAVITLQRGAFGDIASSAHYFSEVWQSARLYSNEAYRENVYAPKAEFWSGRPVEYYYPNHPEFGVGDIVLLHNSYGDLEDMVESLRERFELRVLGEWRAKAIPLLPDIMVFPNQVGLTSNPPAMAFRFTRQSYMTIALRAEKAK